ncbi:MAG: tRNA (N(6)-L-threonylcarbamoyladenosine(37)-C(2))-methylthiotransferase MtaB [Thermodesulfatator sp.]|nr:MAG: tRNA (N(6)-L-threonylcarbamoyladenosine(37)-C(2))-methylthiotransferase MtaB [Thermodesulfatator sp.]
MASTFCVLTLGCKVNQVEGAFLEEALAARGWIPVKLGAGPEVAIVNTCAVTSRATAEARKLIRRAQAAASRLVVVTGCYAQVQPEEVQRTAGGGALVLGHKEKFEIPEILSGEAEPLRGEIRVSPSAELRQARAAPVRRFAGHARAFLRVQDGCSQCCSYCIVPRARGPARSLPLREVLRQARIFEEEGFQEVVVTGIHLGVWGRDLSPPATLVDLLRALEEAGSFRIRLSSLEVTEITPALLSWAESSEKFCPHFHVPLQSGDDRILAAMGRPYTRDFYLSVLREIRVRFPEAALGADVMVGFPGEDEEAFLRTYRLIEESPLTYLHVFPYSPRPGTPAATRPRPSPEIAAQRAQALRELAVRKKQIFAQNQVGRILWVLAEKKEEGLWKGTSENYLVVYFHSSEELRGQIVPVKIVEAKGTSLWGKRL